tara:strand:- start:846 stop:1370 length:525 start_codon:yes stop_codon:yes gene_type:complete
MGLFDFALKPGQKFTKDELKILDQNFNSISVYTKSKYQFYSRNIDNDIQGSMANVDCHKMKYSYVNIDMNEDDSRAHREITITKYYVRDEYDLKNLDDFYNSSFDVQEEARVPPPKILNFPTYVLKVGYPSEGFMIELRYKSKEKIDKLLDGSLEDDCIKEIKDKSKKYLKKIS